MRQHDKTNQTGKTPETSPALEELFALLDTADSVPLEHFFDRVAPQRKQKQ
ncbi:hypothetical protein [Yoonia sp.]|uniref:hypothetical protein n=1 Tax=Yoonia sp. TaxID=2212373 RepID=UPI003974C559